MPTVDPVTPHPHLHAFAGYGIELEYMIVESDSLKARPLADRLLADEAGEIVNEVEFGRLAWSNELVMHVIEFKTNGPAGELSGLDALFHSAITEVNRRLLPMNARLLPTAMHPLFVPVTDTRLWPHGQNEIYAAYDRIFGCQGHGWSNLQSMHINLPFFNDAEFSRLHAAIRLVLPLIPALAAASPVVEGRVSGWMDTRMHYYRDNQKRVPEIAGYVVPEAILSIDDYHRRVLAPMYEAVRPLDPDGILDDDWLNSRGAIARFERQTIEMRIIDIQESPRADLAIAGAVVGLVRNLHSDDALLAAGQRIEAGTLADQLFAAARAGGEVVFDHAPWLALFGRDGPVRGRDLWRDLIAGGLPDLDAEAVRTLGEILDRGTLAEAIVRRTGPEPGREALVECYRELAGCLAENRLFQP